MDQVLNDIGEDEGRFKRHRHDGSKSDKFRTLVSQSLAPIQSVGGIVAHATKTVRSSAIHPRRALLIHE